MFNYNPIFPLENPVTTPDTGMIEVIPDNNSNGTSPATTLPAPVIPGVGNVQVPSSITTLPGWIGGSSSGNYPPQFPPFMPPNNVVNVLQLCMNNLMYITTRNGESFWYYPTDIAQNSVNGYRWNQQAGWFNYSVAFMMIQNAYCYNP